MEIIMQQYLISCRLVLEGKVTGTVTVRGTVKVRSVAMFACNSYIPDILQHL